MLPCFEAAFMRAGRSKAAIARHAEITTETLHRYLTGGRPIPPHRRSRLSAAMGGAEIDWNAYERERQDAQERPQEPRKLTRDPGPAPARQKPPEAPPAPQSVPEGWGRPAPRQKPPQAPPAPPVARPAPVKTIPAPKPPAPPKAAPVPAPKAPPKRTMLFGFIPLIDDTEDEE